MKERPIIFSGPMVRAILGGQKTMTRRLMTPQPRIGTRGDGSPCYNGGNAPDGLGDVYHVWEPRAGSVIPLTEGCRYRWEQYSRFRVDRRMWVRETWYDDNGLRHTEPAPAGPDRHIFYRADGEPRWEADANTPWRPSIYMPRWASRIDLRITAHRVERLHEITEDDARAEGVTIEHGTMRPLMWLRRNAEDMHVHAFARLWEALNGKRAPWASNPWVEVGGFERVWPKEAP